MFVSKEMQTYKYTPPTPIAQPVLHLKMTELMIQKIIAEIEDGGAPTIRLASTGDHFVRNDLKFLT